MKISQLKSIIREIVTEELQKLFDGNAISESNNSNVDKEKIRERFYETVNHGRNDIYGEISPKTKVSQHVAPPTNPKIIKDGEKYASGQGLMEWYKKSGGKGKIQSELNAPKHSDDDINNFIKRIGSRKL